MLIKDLVSEGYIIFAVDHQEPSLLFFEKQKLSIEKKTKMDIYFKERNQHLKKRFRQI